jgi:hypothetical protein
MSTAALVHVLAPPVGLVEVRMLPFASPTTQSAAEGHETVDRALLDM